MLEPGAILVICEKPEVLFVTIKKNLGYRQGSGWLLYTTGGNYLHVTMEEQNAGLKYMQRVIFITDKPTLAKLPKVIV